MNREFVPKKRSLLCYFFMMSLIFIPISNAALSDPTQPIISPEVHESPIMDESNYNLQSILIGSARRLAMINGQTVGIGSTIQGARVLAIGKNHVVLFYAGQRKVLYLFGRRLWKAH